MTRPEILRELGRIRSSIHACNRNPIPSSSRLEWRDMLDGLIQKLDAEMGALDRQPPTDETARLQNCTHDWATDGMGDYCRYCGKRE
jgi:hypothetical protein